MERFFIITNLLKDPQLKVAKQIQRYLEAKGKNCIIQECISSDGIRNYKYTDPSQVPEDIECVLVLGGDGTVLQASRDLVDRNIPLFGINLGTLGYLAEIDRESIEPAMDKLVLDEYVIEERMMLEGSAYHLNKKLMSDIALNDIVISRSGRIRVMDFHIYVNGRFLNFYSADGIIVSTPTGSTGYNLSAGGPIVSPAASMILITPIAPHTLTARSVILPDDAGVKIEIGQRGDIFEEAEATFDGDTTVKMTSKDYIHIQKSGRTVRLIKTDEISFLEILRRKMSST